MRHSRNMLDLVGGYRDRVGIDSLSVSKDEELFQIAPKAPIGQTGAQNRNYKPLLALNIEIGEPEPVKIFIYDFTDPWKRAYEFIKAYDLPEEMHEEIAILIGNAKEAKEKELKMQKLAQDKTQHFNLVKPTKPEPTKQTKQLHKPIANQRNANSCELRHSNSTGVYQAYPSTTYGLFQRDRNAGTLFSTEYTPQESSTPLQNTNGNLNSSCKTKGQLILERNLSSENFSKRGNSNPPTKAALFQKEEIIESKILQIKAPLTQNFDIPEMPEKKPSIQIPIEKSNTVLESTALISTESDRDRQSKTITCNASPFASAIGELSDLEYSAFQPSQIESNRPSEIRWSTQFALNHSNHGTAAQKPQLSPKPELKQLEYTLTKPDPTCQKEKRLVEIFSQIDYLGRGQIKSFQVYSSNLSTQHKHVLHTALSAHERKTGLDVYTLDRFRGVVEGILHRLE